MPQGFLAADYLLLNCNIVAVVFSEQNIPVCPFLIGLLPKQHKTSDNNKKKSLETLQAASHLSHFSSLSSVGGLT